MLSVGVVVIGRNEGERLLRCFDSIRGRATLIVYVDSGSTDGSVDAAMARGVDVLSLDLSRPFTAARARNVGWRRALERMPDLQAIQFVDGDCEVESMWLESAWTFLSGQPKVAAVCGQRRERFPQHSWYNRLCDLEWRKAPGPVRSCGGDVMMRTAALSEVGGYRDDLIAGEEPELCVRLRGAGWEVHAMADTMTWHDAAMTRFSQWWTRIRRSGYAYAQGAFLHGRGPERHNVRESRRAWAWGLGVPMVVGVGVLSSGWSVAWALLIYPLQVLRLIALGEGGMRDRTLAAVFHTVGRFPEVLGQLQFLRDRLLGRQSRLIEYK